jgi:WD40 repeat protein
MAPNLGARARRLTDGGIAIWRAGGEWEHLKMMKGHRGAVNALAVHPSGRLALSVAHDRQLRMWDLLRCGSGV